MFNFILFNFFSPLEQFDVLILNTLGEYIFLFDFSNMVGIFFVFLVFFVFLGIFGKKFLIVPNTIQLLIEILYKFFLGLLKQQAGDDAKMYFPLIYFVFFFILLSNLFGMLPFGFTITAHFSITFFLSFAFNLGFLFLGIYKNGLDFFKLFVPKGAPVFLLPLIIAIEIVSYLIRTFSLSIRLFANMMAGHCSLFVVSSFVYSAIAVSVGTLIFFIFIYLFVFVLEFAIAFLQAYVFTILLAIYLNDALSPGH
jgi:F-type H+-transporting ATPase subunit a